VKYNNGKEKKYCANNNNVKNKALKTPLALIEPRQVILILKE